jgi:hypothetical protein
VVFRSYVRVSSSSSCSFSVRWGWKTCAKCLAKACAFLAPLLAQVPCVVLVGGYDLVICMEIIGLV